MSFTLVGGVESKSEVDHIVAQILAGFDLTPPKGTRWHRRMVDLRWVVSTDYTKVFQRFIRAGVLPLDRLQERAAVVFPKFNEIPMRFNDCVERVSDRSAGLGVQLRMSAHGKAVDSLRGFYHQPDARRPLIWLNVRHTPTAMAATLAHEVGHFFWDTLHAEPPAATRPFYNADFSGHLEDPGELFADAFATIAAYPKPVASRLFRRSGWPRTFAKPAGFEETAIADIHEYLRQHHGADLGPRCDLSPPHRLHYIVSMIHFAKVRAATLHSAGL